MRPAIEHENVTLLRNAEAVALRILRVGDRLPERLAVLPVAHEAAGAV